MKNFSQQNFDQKAYETFVQKALKLSVFEFEKAYRETLLIEKFQDTLSKLVQVSDEEIYNVFLYEGEKLSIRYCEIPFDQHLNSVSVTPDELKNYFDENQETFRVGAQRELDYTAISIEKLKEGVDISPERIEKYYRRYRKSFKGPLTEVSEVIEEKLKAKKARDLAKKLSKKIYQGLSKGKSLEELSKKSNLTVEHIPYFTQDRPPLLFKERPDILRNIFQNELQEPLEIVSLKDLIFILVPVSEKPSYVPEFDEAQDKAREILIEVKAREKAKDEAQLFLAKVDESIKQGGVLFEEACKQLGRKTVKSLYFTRRDANSPIDSIFQLKQAALNSQGDKISEVLPTSKGYAFFIVEESLYPLDKEFEAQKEALHERVFLRKKQKVFFEYFQSLLKQCQFFEVKK